MHRQYDLIVYAIKSRMFKGDDVAPQLAETLDELGLTLIWDSAEITADIVILHNPSFLKFQSALLTRIVAKHLIVVTHENFVRPGGAAGFDVGKCLELLDRNSLAIRKIIAPISPLNRETVAEWLTDNPSGIWQVADSDWFNICDFEHSEPTDAPRDRRGRFSRAGYEKFPSLADMDLCFPATSEANVILGADSLLNDEIDRAHWKQLRFRQIDVAQFMEQIDFMIYFTAPTWRESFGRVLAEATAAGKLVITDPSTAQNFGDGLISATPQEVDTLVAGFIAEPSRYVDQVRKAQSDLLRLSPSAFLEMVSALFNPAMDIAS